MPVAVVRLCYVPSFVHHAEDFGDVAWWCGRKQAFNSKHLITVLAIARTPGALLGRGRERVPPSWKPGKTVEREIGIES